MDILSDTSNMQLCRIAERYAMPTYVSNSEPLEKSAAEELPAELFADPGARMFPINNKANTWLSAAFFNENREKMAEDRMGVVESLIKKAGSIYNIDQDIKDVFSVEKEASAEENEIVYCYTDEKGGKHYPVAGPEGVKKACDYFEKKYRNYSPKVRTTIARGIAKVAQSFGTDPSRVVMIEGGFGIVDRAALASEVLERAKMTKDAEAAALLGNINNLLEVMDSSELAAETEKIAEVMENIDILNGMDRSDYWSPLQAVCPMTVKEAQAIVDNTLELDGLTFDVTKLASSLDPQVFTDVLGEEFIPELTTEEGVLDAVKLAEVLPTLPLPDKRLLAKHIVAMCEA
jgi:hypothetical protein